MKKLSIEQALSIVSKIDLGIQDFVTRDDRFAPLWEFHFLREAFMDMLIHAEDVHADFYRRNFENVCALMDPDFADIMHLIDLPDDLDIMETGLHISD